VLIRSLLLRTQLQAAENIASPSASCQTGTSHSPKAVDAPSSVTERIWVPEARLLFVLERIGPQLHRGGTGLAAAER
jgi:hypothetical protein